MTIHMLDNIHNYIGLSTDTKPVSPLTGSTFFETDTKQEWIYIGSAWVIKGRNFFDLSSYPVKAQGTTDSDGVQYDTEVVTVDVDTDYALFAFDSSNDFPKLDGNLAWVHYNIIFSLKAGNASADLKWKLQARNKGGTWTDMCAEQTESNINTTYIEKRIKGYLDIKTNIITAPFEMKLIFQSNEATPGIGTGKVKNSTIIRMVGEVA